MKIGGILGVLGLECFVLLEADPMKHALVIMTVILLSLTGVAQENIPEPTQPTDVPYRLFRSQNIYTLLKLDTRTGEIWQVQWGTDPGYRFVAPINLKPLAPSGKVGRFTLYPTLNIYTFILLDQDTGTTWQVQWGKQGERFVLPLE